MKSTRCILPVINPLSANGEFTCHENLTYILPVITTTNISCGDVEVICAIYMNQNTYFSPGPL